MSSPLIDLHIDFASNTLFSGWAVESKIKCFPTALRLVSSKGQIISMSEMKRIARPDVCEQKKLPPSTLPGFNLNLLDVFNDRLNDYALFFHGEKVWSFREYLLPLEEKKSLETHISIPFFCPIYGKYQVIVVFETGSYLACFLQRIASWRPHSFLKEWQHGVSFAFFTIKEFSSQKDRLLKQQSQNILVLDKKVYIKAFTISPTLLSSYPTIILDEIIDTRNDYNGLLSTLLSLLHINSPMKLTSLHLLHILNAIGDYSELFFNSIRIYFFLYGTLKEWMKTYIRRQNNLYPDKDILVLSEMPLKRLADIETTECAFFIHTGATRYLLDIMENKPLLFLQAAYKRGMRVGIYTPEIKNDPSFI